MCLVVVLSEELVHFTYVAEVLSLRFVLFPSSHFCSAERVNGLCFSPDAAFVS